VYVGLNREGGGRQIAIAIAIVIAIAIAIAS
jgi:hypothetical protein